LGRLFVGAALAIEAATVDKAKLFGKRGIGKAYVLTRPMSA
jgi:hypothetical protein